MSKVQVDKKATYQEQSQSSLEQCSFVVHILVFPVGAMYVAWVLVSEETLESWNITYYPPKSWALHIPTSLLCLLFAVLFLYPAVNALSVPKLNSSNVISDEYTRTQLKPDGGNGAVSTTLHDLDPASLRWYRRE